MDIIWHGQSCFTIKGKNATIVTDPNGSKLKADIIISSLPAGEAKLPEVEGEHMIFDMPGEYERLGVAIRGVQVGEKMTAFVMDIDGMKVCHLGQISKVPTDEMVQALGNVDILLVPVGGKVTVDAKKAVEIVEDVEARVIIPMHFKIDGEKLEIAGVNEFMKEVGGKNEPMDKFSVDNKAKLPQDHELYIVLNPQR